MSNCEGQVRARCTQCCLGAGPVLLIWRQPQEAAGIFDAEGWDTFCVNVESVDNQYTAVRGHPRPGHGCDIQPLEHPHGIELVEAEVGRVVIRPLDDIAGCTKSRLTERHTRRTDVSFRREKLRYCTGDRGASVLPHELRKCRGGVLGRQELLDLQWLKLLARS